MTSHAVSLLHGLCICGEPIFRHRTINGRQLTCWQLRVLDRTLEANAQPPDEAYRRFQILRGGGDGDRVREVS